MLDRGEKFVFIDCRLPNEYQITHIEGTTADPAPAARASGSASCEDKENEKIVVHCKSGGAVAPVRAGCFARAGFKDVKSMAGGILLWNKDVNPGGPQY